MFRKNTTTTDIEPDPSPHPCGNWSTLDCHMLARGYNTPFWDDPYKDDVSNNSTLPCSPEDCNNTGLDSSSLTPSYYIIIGLGGLLTVVAMVVLYRKLGGATHNGYNQLPGDTHTPLTAEWLKIHDQESQHVKTEEKPRYDTNTVVNGLYQASSPGQIPYGLQASPSNVSCGSNTSSDIVRPYIETFNFPVNGHISSDDESNLSDDDRNSTYSASSGSP